VVAELIRSGILEVRPGIGTVVTATRRVSAEERRQLLSDEVEALVVEAKRLGLEQEDVVRAVEQRWSELSHDGGGEQRRRGE
jgi:DNA-binding transcriptional regulator YhcF (GntR family)